MRNLKNLLLLILVTPVFLLFGAVGGGGKDSDDEKDSEEDPETDEADPDEEKAVTTTQKELNAKFADRQKRGETAATAKILKDLNVTSLDDARKLVEAARKADDENKDEVQKALDAQATAEAKADQAEKDAQAVLDKANKKLLDGEIKLLASAIVKDSKDPKKVVRPAFNPKALSDVLLLIDRKDIKQNEEDDSFEGIEKALSKLAKDKPYLLEVDSGKPTTSKGSPSESNNNKGKKSESEEEEKEPSSRRFHSL